MDLSKIKEPLETKIIELGFIPYSISLKRVMGKLTLEVVIDRKESIDLKTIGEVSSALSDYLDQIDDSEESYNLDVSSLGAEKPLKVTDLKDYVGSYINLHLINPIEGNNIFEGTIDSVSFDSFTFSYRIKTRVKTINILFSNIYKIRLAIKF